MMALSDAERHEMGDRGRKLVDASYTWDAVVRCMIAEYAEVLAGKVVNKSMSSRGISEG